MNQSDAPYLDEALRKFRAIEAQYVADIRRHGFVKAAISACLVIFLNLTQMFWWLADDSKWGTVWASMLGTSAIYVIYNTRFLFRFFWLYFILRRDIRHIEMMRCNVIESKRMENKQ